MVISPLAQIINSEGLLLIEGDCVQIMSNLPAECVDSVVTDPPYGLEFMGKEWDKLGSIGQTSHSGPATRASGERGQYGKITSRGSSNVKCLNCGKWRWDYPERTCRCERPEWPNVAVHQARIMQDWHYSWAVEALRLLKPGGHMLVFGGTRTYHRLACAVEDAGFEIRDSIHWVYGSGFPKSMDVGKAIDKAAGAEREVISEYSGTFGMNKTRVEQGYRPNEVVPGAVTKPATDEAKQWDGWGTALKPAHEPILLARKPLGEKNVAGNVLKWGTGGLNIDGGRIGTDDLWKATGLQSAPSTALQGGEDGSLNVSVSTTHPDGRFPANFILSHDEECEEACVEGCPVAELGAQSGMGASRFFYQAKSPKSERNSGCESLYWRRTKSGHEPITQDEYGALDPKARAQGNIHPTVKPLSLMRYLVRLITPPNGIVLEPFLGSGTTALAAHQESFGCLAMEQDPNSALISRARWSNR